MELLYSIDEAVFIFLNRDTANPVFDFFMVIITKSDYWLIPIAAVWLALIIFGGRKGRITAILVVVVVVLSDKISSSLLKPLIERTRPCFTVEGCRVLIKQSHSYSFPSSHAANMGSAAFLFSFKYRRYAPIFIAVAILVGYSRIYVGVHYPLDVVAGFILGAACGFCIIGIERMGVNIMEKRKKKFVLLKNSNGAGDGNEDK